MDIIERRFKLISGAVFQSVPSEAEVWAKSLTMEWREKASVNAGASFVGKQSVVFLNKGIASKLWYSFQAVMQNPLFLQEPGQGQGVPYDLSQPIALITSVIGQNKLTEEYIDVLKAFEEADPERALIGIGLFYKAVDFLIMHEINHFWCGHVYYFQNKTQRLSPSRESPMDFLPSEIRRSLEIHADKYAVRRIIELYEILPSDRVIFCSNWLLSISILFVVLSPKPLDYELWNIVDYPHPHIRFSELAIIAQTIFERNFDISDVDWDNILRRWLLNVSYIEILGKGYIVPPFADALAFQKSVVAETERYYEIIRHYIPAFEKARVDMCSWLS